MSLELKKIPYQGLGVGLRSEIAEEIMRHKGEIEALEVIAEKFFPNLKPESQPFISRFKAFPIIPHGVKLSIGSTEPLERDFVRGMQELIAQVKAPYYSDHFALTRMGQNLDTGHLSPLWYTRDMLEHIVSRIDTLQQALGVPLVLENITAPFIFGEADFEEPEFITQVCNRTGCGLLLDVTNVHINAFNQKKNAQALLERYPIDAVVQIHLAGGECHGDHFHDSHSQPIDGPNEGVWPLFEWVIKNADFKTVIIERDDNFTGDFESMILNDLRRARSIVEKGKASALAVQTPLRTPQRAHSSSNA